MISVITLNLKLVSPKEFITNVKFHRKSKNIILWESDYGTLMMFHLNLHGLPVGNQEA